MPLTPFHIGHALPFSFIDFKKKRVDVLTAFVSSMIVDIHAIMIWFFGVPGQLHGIVHTYLIGTLLGVSVGIFFHLTDPFWQKILFYFKWKQKTSLFQKIFIGVLMTWIHLLLDAFLYPEMVPFWPFISGNPFYGWLKSSTVYLLCTIGILIGIIEYFGYILWKGFKKETKAKKEPNKAYYQQFKDNKMNS